MVRSRLALWALCVALAMMPTAPFAQSADMVPEPRPDDLVTRADRTPPVAVAPPRLGPSTGLPLPRFVSLAAVEGNVRRGPSLSHRIDWVFQRQTMPLMVVAEHGHWRRVIDRDGVGGWMFHTLLSGARYGIVERPMIDIHARPDAQSALRARAEEGVVLRLRECRPDWCRVEAGGHRGWVATSGIWGVAAGETFD